MREMWGTSAVMATVAALLAASPALADCKLGKMAELPLTMRGSRPETIAKINGREDRFLVDSGSFYSVISPGTAAENGLKLRSGPYGMRMVGIGGSADVDVTTVKTFTLAGFDLTNIDFIVGGSEVGGAGVIGQNVLHIGDVEYDLPHGVIRLMAAKGCGNKVLAYWIKDEPLSELPLIESSERLAHTYANVRINGQTVRAMFDTGAGTTVLSQSVASRLGIKVNGPGVTRAGFSRGFGSKMVPSWVVPVASIEIGGEKLSNTHLIVQDLGDTEMLVGADFFMAHHVYVANSQHKMWFNYVGGGFFDALDKHSKAIDGAGKAIDVTDTTAVPKTAEEYSARGLALLSKGDKEHALADLDQAVTLAPLEPRYLVQRAQVQGRMGHPKLAEQDLDKALTLKPDDTEVLLRRGTLYLAERRRDLAMADLDRASGLLDKASDYRFELGSIFMSTGQPVKAIPQFDQWIEAHPVDSRRPIALNERCWARALLDQELPKALSDCNAAVRTMPHKEAGLDSRGLVQLRSGNIAAAIRDYDAALQINPKLAWALYGRGLAKLKLGDVAGSAKDIADAKTAMPTIADVAAKWGVGP